VEKVNLLKPDAVFITGDLFDGMDGNFDNVSDALNQIQAPDGIYFVTGNHETYFGLDKVNKILAQTKIKVLNDDVVDVKGLQIIGTLFPGDGQSRDIETVIKNNPNYVFGKPTILLHHAPTEIDQAKRLGVNLQLSGHTHKGQIFPFGYVTKLIYRGYDYGLHTEGDYNIYTTNGVGTWGPPMRTGNTPEIVDITLK
jgi:hypothetical protein